MVRLLLDFNVVVLENPQQRTGKRGAHFGSLSLIHILTLPTT